jgi:hypothetical protein
MALKPEHALFVYLWEAALFTSWPFNRSEPLYSPTNCIGAAVGVGIAASVVLFAHNRIHNGARLGHHDTAAAAACCWDYSIQARKLSVVLFYVQPITVAGCGVLYMLVRWARACCIPGRYSWSEAFRHCVDGLVGICIATLTIANRKGMYLLPFVIQRCFFSEYTALSYLFQQMFFLSLFACLY